MKKKLTKHLIIYMVFFCAAMPAWAHCWQQAGMRYNIDPLLLQAIAQVESGLNPQARNLNADGSYDVGLMQINSRHFARLATFGITEKRLINEPCTSVMVGAWILAEFVQHVGYNWNAVGAYNAGTAPKRQPARNRYIKKVAQQYGHFNQRISAKSAPSRNKTKPLSRPKELM